MSTSIFRRSIRCIFFRRASSLTSIAKRDWPIDELYPPVESLRSIAEPDTTEVIKLQCFLSAYRQILCLTGAGISTSSGIPDYRGPGGTYKVANHKPITHQEFMGLTSLSSVSFPSIDSNITQENKNIKNGELSRKRYWSRALGGYQRLQRAVPNDAHLAVHKLFQIKKLLGLVTQNVDGLHQKCFDLNPIRHNNVQECIVDLHGRIDRVLCMQCGHNYSRDEIQDKIFSLNPALKPFHDTTVKSDIENSTLTILGTWGRLRPDGDMDMENIIDYAKIEVPCCEMCKNGILKPDVVFFGDNVKKEKVDFVYEKVQRADALLIVGSSLEVFSAYRFVDRADKLGIPIAIINFGETRAERKGLKNVVYRSSANCSTLLREAVNGISLKFI